MPIAIVFLVAASAAGANKTADPTNYRTVISGLVAGDVLTLSAGLYTNNLYITGRNGTPSNWITIQGPASGVAEIRASSTGTNCCEITNSSYVAIKNLKFEGQHWSGPFAFSAKGEGSNTVHHILIEGCTIVNWDGGQQTVGISTKATTWDWTIRGNTILRCGTGLYLGNSDGSCPFIRGTIENNLIQDPIGYCMEIKWQSSRTAKPGMPTDPCSTIIRDNVWIKNNSPGESARPNMLVGGFPTTGLGSNDLYEIYGNLYYHNPYESLLQASGRVAIHDNVFVDGTGGPAIALQNHDLPLRLAHVYNNTIYSAYRGIRVLNVPDQGHAIIGNVAFADVPLYLTGGITNVSGNLTGPTSSAAAYLTNPTIVLGSANLYPLIGQCQGTPLDLSAFAAQAHYDLDFNKASKGARTFRGAYAGAGTNPGWQLQAGLKPVVKKPGDVDGDGHVDVVDLLYLVDAFGSLTGDPSYNAACDFNSDGSVDVVDLLMLVENFGT
jgi:hypothetical protein